MQKSKYQDYEPVSSAQSGLNDLSKPMSPVVDPPLTIPVRYESMLQDDPNYERIENISNAWKTRDFNDMQHT